MSSRAKLSRIERRIGDIPCPTCAKWKITHTYVDDGEPDPPAIICPKCGRHLMQIVVRYVETDMHGNLIDDAA